MATDTHAELDATFYCLAEGGLDDFEPEAPRNGTWPQAAAASPADVQRWERFVPPRPAQRSWPLVVPVVAAAAIAGAAVSWSMIARERPVTTPLLVAPPPVVNEPVRPAVVPLENLRSLLPEQPAGRPPAVPPPAAAL